MLQIKCEQKFSMGSTYDYSKQIQNTIMESIPGWVKSKCFIRKIIRSICNLVKINPLECCLLAWLLAKSKYDIEKISTDSRTKIVQEEFDQKVLLFVLMNAYYVKEFVCEQLQPEIDSDILKQIPNFKHLYNKKFNPQKSLKTLSLSDINKIFNQWTCRQTKKNKMDYNNLVDKILYLSKSYNVSHDQAKQQKLGAPRKKRKTNNPSNFDENQVKSDLQSQNQDKSESNMQQNRRNKPKQGHFRFNNTPQAVDFIGPSQENQNIFKRQQAMDMIQSKRTTRNMLQSLNVYDYIPSQDNLFNSQVSSFSVNNMMGSQHSGRNLMGSQSIRNEIFDMNSTIVKKSKQKPEKETGNQMKLRKTQSFDEIK